MRENIFLPDLICLIHLILFSCMLQNYFLFWLKQLKSALFFFKWFIIYIWACVNMEARRGHQMSSSIILCLFFWGRVSPEIGIHVFSTRLEACKLQECSCLHPILSCGYWQNMWLVTGVLWFKLWSSWLCSKFFKLLRHLSRPSLKVLLWVQTGLELIILLFQPHFILC